MRRVAVIALAILIVATVIGATRVHDHEGYFSPVYSPDGQFVYFVSRHTRGLVTGLGWEFFSPPAHVFVWRDRFSLRRLDRVTGQVEVVTTLPPSPVEGQHLRTYRGRAFTEPATVLRWGEAERLEVRLRISIPIQPTSEQHFLQFRWEGDLGEQAPAEWNSDWVALTDDDVSPIFEEWELVAVRGPEAFPCALVQHDAVSDEVHLLLEHRVCREFYPAGITAAELDGLTRRADIERVQSLEDTRARLTRDARASGMTEGEAALHVIDQMADLGLTRRSPQLVAEVVDSPTVDVDPSIPVFIIGETQFAVGLFQDLERALDSPGVPVDKSMGTYVVHDDYTTSQELNAFLQGGGSRFRVRRGVRLYDVRVSRP